MFETGEGVAQDHPEAVRLHRHAASQGNALAVAKAGRFAQSSPPARRRPGAMPLSDEHCA